MIRNDLSTFITRRREVVGLTQRELAKRTNLTPAAICKYESGTRTPSLYNFYKLSKVLGLTMDALYQGLGS